ncbi:hypothetical protein [Nocardia miyunensis]|uniref:hypothetical protein n=1 Tax=Nocardia miyunensis TaxID=282684 RepID=UPI001FDFC3BC|nr:hypothetical protein [Nocardia miyunensis]
MSWPRIPDAPPLLAELVEACRRAGLARFKHVEHIELVSNLPRSPMGKLVKHDILRDIPARRVQPLEDGNLSK